jgi:hypothetical protein
MQFGSSKLVLQHGSKVKVGDAEDSVDGTYVNLTGSGTKLSAFQVAVGGRSSTAYTEYDFIKAGGDIYLDPVWKSFGLKFQSVTPGLTDASRDMIRVSPSGDNLLQVVYTDDRGNEKTINWAYKAASTDTTFTLADNGGNPIVVVEGRPIAKDAYFTTSAGEFSHLFRVSSLSADGSSSASADLTDVFSTNSLKLNLGTGNDESRVIDGQTFYIQANSTHLSSVTWGSGAAVNNSGSFVTVFPTIKGRKGEKLAFFVPNATVDSPNGAEANGWKIDLPTGAVNVTLFGNATDPLLRFAAAAKEDGTSSALVGTTVDLNLSEPGNSALLTLGRTTTGGLVYNVTGNLADNNTVIISVVGETGSTARLLQPGLILVEERDDNSDAYAVVVSASTEASGSNNVGIPSNPIFTATEDSATLGSDSTITDYVDLYGTYAKRTTSGQDTLTIYYPDEQVTANLFVLESTATVTQTAGGSSSTVKSAAPVKTALGKLDTEVTSADKSTKSLILVGGPAVNSLVAELATAGKTRDVQWYRDQGAGTALVDLVEDAFASGRSALVVAGHSAADTRAATSALQNYDAYTWASDRVVLKNGVITSGTA